MESIELTHHLFKRLSQVPNVRIYGPLPKETDSDRAALAAFNVKGLHASDAAALLDQDGVAIRSGHHCTQPLHSLMEASGSARASLSFYNTRAEIDRFIDSLQGAIAFFGE